MKIKQFFTIALLLLVSQEAVICQVRIDTIPTVEIHQIDVGQGDATFIKVNAIGRTYSILIDAGDIGYGADVREYIWGKKYTLMDSIHPYLDLVIVSHYDQDHIGGLSLSTETSYGVLDYINVEDSKDPIEADTVKDYVFCKPIEVYAIMDPGSYPGPRMVTKMGVAKKDTTFTIGYQKYVEFAGSRRVAVGVPGASQEMLAIPLILNDHTYPPMDDADIKLGGKILLGTDLGGTPITLQLIASNAYLFSPTLANPWGTYDVTTLYDKFSRNETKTKLDNNNFCLAWILEYGQFRYYTGGDLSGINDGKYFDLETPLSVRMPAIIPDPAGIAGHVCAMKLNHHGSKNSSNQNFISALKPTTVSVSCSTKFPHPDEEVCRIINTSKWSNSLLSSKECASMIVTQLTGHKTIDGNKLKISGNKNFVFEKDIPQTINQPNGGGTINSSKILGKQALSTIKASRKTLKRGRSWLEENQNPTSLEPPMKTKLADDELVITKLVSTKQNKLPNVDGDYVIKVYPTLNGEFPITDFAHYTITTRSPVAQEWMAPIQYICHRKALPPPPTTK